jgi:REP element-mobilizing transposase RayT
MPYDPRKHHRRSVRLRGYDYAGGGTFFVTICAHRKEPLFGEVAGGEIRLNAVGEIARDEWYRSAEMRAEVLLDAFVVMPNHIHGIVALDGSVAGGGDDRARALAPGGARGAPLQRPAGSLGAFVAGYKARVTSRVRALTGESGKRVWQRNYYEHIIRDDREADEIRLYVVNNVLTWADDPDNPAASGRTACAPIKAGPIAPALRP